MGKTKVVDWPGLPVREIQLGDDIDAEDHSAAQAEMLRQMDEKSKIEQGLVRRVPKKKTPTDTTDARKVPIHRGHATDYDAWSAQFNESDEESDEEYELVPVTEEEREREAARKQAETNALHHKEKGNEYFKTGSYSEAVKSYTSGLRHLPTAVLFSNRAQALLKLGKFEQAASDCTKALLFDEKLVKAYIRRAKAYEAEGKFDAAQTDIKHARELDPKNVEVKRLMRSLEAAIIEKEYEDTLRAAAVSGTEGTSAALPAGAAEELAEINRIVESARAAKLNADNAKAIKSQLTKLKRLLKNAERNQDFFACVEGVPAILDLFSEDNHLVLSVLAEACKGNERNVNALAKTNGVELLVKTVRDRRVAVIGVALELLLSLLKANKSTCIRLREPPYLETMVLMLARGPPSLHERVLSCLKVMASNKKVAYDLRAFAPNLVEGLARACGSANASTREEAVGTLAALARTDAKLGAALGAEAILEALGEVMEQETQGAPLLEAIEFTGGATLQYKDFHALKEDHTRMLVLCLQVLLELAVSPKFVGVMDSREMWFTLLPLISSSKDDIIGPAIALLHRCCTQKAVVGLKLGEMGAAEALLEVAEARRGAGAGAAALGVLRAAAEVPLVQEALVALQGPARLLPLLGPALSDAALADLCVLLHFAANFSAEALAHLATHPQFAKGLVTLWYGRSGSTREEVEALLMKVMNEEEGAKTLSEDMSEQQVVKFVSDLRVKRQMAVARATGGANILNPEKYNPSGVPLSQDRVVEDKEREAELAKVDTGKLAQYIGTLIPRSVPNPVIIDTLAGTGRVCIELARRLAERGAYVYASEREAHVAEYLSRRSQGSFSAPGTAEEASKCSNFSAVASPEDELEGVPVAGDVILLLGTWSNAGDPVKLMRAAVNKLKAGGKVILIEDDVNLLAHAKKAGLKEGLVIYSEPDLLSDHYMTVMNKPC